MFIEYIKNSVELVVLVHRWKTRNHVVLVPWSAMNSLLKAIHMYPWCRAPLHIQWRCAHDICTISRKLSTMPFSYPHNIGTYPHPYVERSVFEEKSAVPTIERRYRVMWRALYQAYFFSLPPSSSSRSRVLIKSRKSVKPSSAGSFSGSSDAVCGSSLSVFSSSSKGTPAWLSTCSST